MKQVAMMVGLTSIAIGFLLLAIYVEEPALMAQVTTPPGMLLDEWLQTFRLWATLGIGSAWIAAVLWYVIAATTNMNDWSHSASRRGMWASLLLLPLAALAAALFFTPRAQEGTLLATSFYFVNNVLVYYIASLWFSPASFKYAPPGAALMRRHW